MVDLDISLTSHIPLSTDIPHTTVRARSTDISDALALDLTQQWDGESFISALNAMPLTEEVAPLTNRHQR